jgi:glycosyltransferase involved in cell wall biosynthesis
MRSPQDSDFNELRRRAKEQGCPLIEIDDYGPLSFSGLQKIADVCRNHNVQVWHGHDYKSNLFGILLRPILGFRLVTTVHGWVTHTSRTPMYYAIDRWTLRRYEHVITVSNDLFERCNRLGVGAKRLHLIENGIDTDHFRRICVPELAPSRAQVPPGRLVIGAVGRLSEEKGFDLLIRAVEKLLCEGRDLELWIGGEGPERDKLAAQAVATGYGSRIRLVGFQKDPRELFAAFDLFCLSSIREGLPNVVLEAMAMEVPIVATRCGGIETFARDRDDMVLVSVGAVDALADGVRCLVQDPTMRKRLATAARRRVERECSFRARMERVIDVYDRLWSPAVD